MKESKGIRDYDWWLFALVFTICGISLLEIWSATHASHLAGMQWKQVWWIVFGVIGMMILSRIDYHTILEQAPIFYLIGIGLLIAVLAVGHTRFGSKRWLPVLGPVLQVSELVKLIIIIVLARYFSELRSERLDLVDLAKVAILVGVPLALILKQPDLGTALVLVPLTAVGAFLAGLQWKHAAALLLLGAMMVPVGWHFLKPYQRDRVNTFLRPEDNPKGAGYQILQSKIAVGSGGFWGKGSATEARTRAVSCRSGTRILFLRRWRRSWDLPALWLHLFCTWHYCCAWCRMPSVPKIAPGCSW